MITRINEELKLLKNKIVIQETKYSGTRSVCYGLSCKYCSLSTGSAKCWKIGIGLIFNHNTGSIML